MTDCKTVVAEHLELASPQNLFGALLNLDVTMAVYSMELQLAVKAVKFEGKPSLTKKQKCYVEAKHLQDVEYQSVAMENLLWVAEVRVDQSVLPFYLTGRDNLVELTC